MLFSFSYTLFQPATFVFYCKLPSSKELNEKTNSGNLTFTLTLLYVLEFFTENENKKNKKWTVFTPAVSVVVVLVNSIFYLNYENMTVARKVARKAKSQKQILETSVNEKFHAC